METPLGKVLGTRSRSAQVATRTVEQIASGIEPVLVALFPTPKPIRLLGVTLSGLETVTGDQTLQQQMALAI